MKSIFTLPIWAAAALATAAMPSHATEATPSTSDSKAASLELSLGRQDFETYCASCHGDSAHGDGPVAEFLALTPADLTKLARQNGGKFPEDWIAHIIDGRQEVKVHGPRDMPVWGDWFNYEAEQPGLRAKEREIVIKERIAALVAYLKSIQEK